MKLSHKKWKQIFAGSVASLGACCGGMAISFPSSVLPQMQKPGSDFPVTEREASFIAGIVMATASIGNVTAGFLTGIFGRRNLLIVCAFPILIGFIISAMAPSAAILIAGRGLIGLGTGGSFVLGAIYNSEITEPSIRGIISTFLNLFLSVGILLEYLAGTVAPDWRILSWINLVFPLLFILLVWILPETPRYLLQQNKEEATIKSLTWLRETECDVQSELQEIKDHMNSKETHKFAIGLLLTKQNMTLFIYVIILGILFGCCGGTIFLTFAEPLGNMLHSSLSSCFLALTLGVTQVLGVICSSTLVDIIGRRRLLQVSGAGMCVTNSALSLYTFLTPSNEEISSALGYLPAILLIVFMGFFSFGYRAIIMGLAAELLPSEIRGVGTAAKSLTNAVTVALLSGAFLPMVRIIHLYGTFLFYAFIGFLAFLFPTLCIPETRGKSLEEIEIETRNRGYFMGIKSKKEHHRFNHQ